MNGKTLAERLCEFCNEASVYYDSHALDLLDGCLRMAEEQEKRLLAVVAELRLPTAWEAKSIPADAYEQGRVFGERLAADRIEAAMRGE